MILSVRDSQKDLTAEEHFSKEESVFISMKVEEITETVLSLELMDVSCLGDFKGGAPDSEENIKTGRKGSEKKKCFGYNKKKKNQISKSSFKTAKVMKSLSMNENPIFGLKKCYENS